MAFRPSSEVNRAVPSVPSGPRPGLNKAPSSASRARVTVDRRTDELERRLAYFRRRCLRSPGDRFSPRLGSTACPHSKLGTSPCEPTLVHAVPGRRGIATFNLLQKVFRSETPTWDPLSVYHWEPLHPLLVNHRYLQTGHRNTVITKNFKRSCVTYAHISTLILNLPKGRHLVFCAENEPRENVWVVVTSYGTVLAMLI